MPCRHMRNVPGTDAAMRFVASVRRSASRHALKPSQIRYATPSQRIAVNTGAATATSAASPIADAVNQIALPLRMPRFAAIALRAPWRMPWPTT